MDHPNPQASPGGPETGLQRLAVTPSRGTESETRGFTIEGVIEVVTPEWRDAVEMIVEEHGVNVPFTVGTDDAGSFRIDVASAISGVVLSFPQHFTILRADACEIIGDQNLQIIGARQDVRITLDVPPCASFLLLRESPRQPIVRSAILLSVEWKNGGGLASSVETDASGYARYPLAKLEGAKRLTVSYSEPPSISFARFTFEHNDLMAGTWPRALLVRPGPSVTFHARDTSGNPVAGVTGHPLGVLAVVGSESDHTGIGTYVDAVPHAQTVEFRAQGYYSTRVLVSDPAPSVLDVRLERSDK